MQVQLAAFARVPLGNVGDDCFSYVNDVLLSRELLAGGHCSWHSPTALADIGGKELGCGIQGGGP